MNATSTRRSRSTAAAYLLTVLLVAAAACLGAVPAAQAVTGSTSHAVVIEHYSYSPTNLTVEVGDTVTWTNKDSVAHDVSVMSGPETFHSPMLAQGQSWTHTFTAAGSYSYMCSVHPDMVASVTVRAAPAHAATHAAAQPRPTTQPSAAAPSKQPAAAPSTPPATKAARHPTAHPTATAVAAQEPAASAQVAAPVSRDGATLDPLLLVAGVSAAVMVFCLLLMTSRPVVKPSADSPPDPQG